jgi:hypothetical protein
MVFEEAEQLQQAGSFFPDQRSRFWFTVLWCVLCLIRAPRPVLGVLSASQHVGSELPAPLVGRSGTGTGRTRVAAAAAAVAAATVRCAAALGPALAN